MKYIKLIMIILLLFQSMCVFAEDERVIMVLEVNNIEKSTGNKKKSAAELTVALSIFCCGLFKYHSE